MRILLAYPNLPLMLVPAVSVGLFTAICKREGVEVALFETTAYTDDPEAGMIFKTKLGNGRAYSIGDIGLDIKPTNTMLDDWRERVEIYQPDLILFSTVEDTFKDTVMMIDKISDLNIPHIVGGVFPINAPEICLNHPSIQTICRYEGEYVVRDVIHRFQKNLPWDDVRGIWTKTKRNPMQPLVDINDVMPDYSLYHPNRFNRAVGGKIVRSINLETYRGCPYSCTFCNSPMTRTLDKNFLRRKNIGTIRKEIEFYVREYQPDYFFFVDDSWVARPRHEVFELCELMEEFGIPWWCNTRIENVDKEILAVMKKGYCDRIQFGIECGNDEYRRKVLKRNVTNAQYEEKIDVINNSGIPYGLNVIIGLPHEKREHIFETVELVKKFAGYDGIAVAIFIPYHGTELRTYAVEHGLLDPSWISGDGYLLGGSALNMPEPYLQKNEIWELAMTFKHYAFFPKEVWPTITTHRNELDKVYNDTFFTKYAVPGSVNIQNRKKVWACMTDGYHDVTTLQNVLH